MAFCYLFAYFFTNLIFSRWARSCYAVSNKQVTGKKWKLAQRVRIWTIIICSAIRIIGQSPSYKFGLFVNIFVNFYLNLPATQTTPFKSGNLGPGGRHIGIILLENLIGSPLTRTKAMSFCGLCGGRYLKVRNISYQL